MRLREPPTPSFSVTSHRGVMVSNFALYLGASAGLGHRHRVCKSGLRLSVILSSLCLAKHYAMKTYWEVEV
jgi:hypothetical protein